MSAQRTERLLNLVICLLATRRYVTREQIRRAVPGYADCESDEAFERMFERDKDDLRDMGVPLETGSNEVLFDDDVGYRIPRDAYSLPDLQLDPEELAVLGLAARVWQQATLAQAATSAVLKLEAGGVDVDPEAWSVVEPRVAADEPAFGPLYEAVRDRRPVTFPYRTAGSAEASVRHVQPWGIVSWHGRWYLVGHDTDRADARVFRLSRVAGPVRLVGEPGTVEVPDDVDLGASVRMLAPAPVGRAGRLRVRQGAALPLRRRATRVEPDPEHAGWDELEIGYADTESLAGEVCGYGPDVVAVDPPELRGAVVRRLSAVLASVGGAS
jgi:proteasome accessory factor B